MNKIILKTIIAFALSFPFIGMASILYPSYGGNVIFTLSPKNPGPNSQVSIKVSSYAMDLTSAKISWYIGDKLETEGTGKDVFSFKTNDIGKAIVIKMIATNDAQRMGRAISIIPADVDVVWEADTYIPPTYKGKAMASSGSSVKIVAIPQFKTEKGTPIQSDELRYEWKKDNNIILYGTGKNVLNINISSPFAQEKINLMVLDKRGEVVAERSINISPEDPEIIFYKENPIEGTEYNSSLTGSINMEETEISVRAEPFFFSYPKTSKEANLTFDWSINGKGVFPNEGTPKIITLRNELNQKIESKISLVIQNIYKTLQTANNEFLLTTSSGFNF